MSPAISIPDSQPAFEDIGEVSPGCHSPQPPMSPHPTLSKQLDERYSGKNSVRCSGRCVAGPELKTVAVTAFLVLTPPALFYVFVAPSWSPLVWAPAILLHILTFLSFCLTAFSDPGILRRRSPPREPVPAELRVTVEGHLMSFTYCRTCNIYRNPRTSHCSTCNNCVDRFDHHCPWTGTCIGLKNYRWYLCFLLFTTLTAVYMICFSMALLLRRMHEINPLADLGSFFKACGDFHWMPALLSFLLVIVVCTVGPLFCFHGYLVTTQQTTREIFKGSYTHSNPFSRGAGRNWAKSWCGKDNYFSKRDPFTSGGQPAVLI